ncbi:MAG TPA: response regulator, partial [Gemmatimonadaceae bacterium]|nr:response regulator [Gemmatimonadaceae bacterium]
MTDSSPHALNISPSLEHALISLSAPLILVADDVPANVELLFDQLQALGYRTIAATDGPSTITACQEHHPDLCILDVAMPARDL